jgi:hypothetical protein
MGRFKQIDEALRLYDRLLLILSEHGMNSEWMKTESQPSSRCLAIPACAPRLLSGLVLRSSRPAFRSGC